MLELNLGAKQKKSMKVKTSKDTFEAVSEPCDSKICDINKADLKADLRADLKADFRADLLEDEIEEELGEIDGVLPDELALDFGQKSNCSSRRSSLKDEDCLFPHKCKKKVIRIECIQLNIISKFLKKVEGIQTLMGNFDSV